jgi:hypothetical protein
VSSIQSRLLLLIDLILVFASEAVLQFERDFPTRSDVCGNSTACPHSRKSQASAVLIVARDGFVDIFS